MFVEIVEALTPIYYVCIQIILGLCEIEIEV